MHLSQTRSKEVLPGQEIVADFASSVHRGTGRHLFPSFEPAGQSIADLMEH